MIKHISSLIFLPILAILFSLVSCVESIVGPDQTWLSVYLEDSPADYQEVEVKIAQAQIYDGSNWMDLGVDKKAIDLLSLTGGINREIVSQAIPSGEYSKFRLVFAAKGNKVKVLDDWFDLTYPDGDTVAQVEMSMNLIVDEKSHGYVYCDIDAASSIIQEDDTTYVFSPVAAMINPLEWGAVHGVISDSKGVNIAERVIVAAYGGDAPRITYTNPQSGRFFLRLKPGVYDISLDPSEASKYSYAVVPNVSVERGEVAELGAVVLENKVVTP